MVLTELIGAVIVALSILYIYYKFVIFNFWHKIGVFYVEPVVPVGNIMRLLTEKVQIGVFFRDIYMKYKGHRAFGIYIFFKPNLIITDLDLIRTVLTKEFGSFHDRGAYCNEKVDPLSGHLFFLPEKKWRNLRIKLTPTFTSEKIKQMFALIKEYSEKLAKYLESKAQMRNTVDMRDMFTRYTADVVMSTAFGIESNCIEEPNNEYRRQRNKLLKLNRIYIAMILFTPQIMDFFSIPINDRNIINFYMNLFRENVKYRKAHNIIKHDFMNLLMQLMEKSYPGSDKETTDITPTINKLTMSEATAQSFFFFLAGFRNPATTATFALHELTQHQDIQDKVRKEIDETLTKHGDLTYDAINEMTYLHKVINETMRKYPPVPILTRICTKEINLPTTNIHLPKGTVITIPVFGVHRDPSIYPDPDKFDPERFNADVVAERHPYAYLPFGAGPRSCIGERFGYIQAKVGLVSLLSKYKFKPHSQTGMPLIFDETFFILVVKDGLRLVIEPRHKSLGMQSLQRLMLLEENYIEEEEDENEDEEQGREEEDIKKEET